jgi:DNA repair protein RadC
MEKLLRDIIEENDRKKWNEGEPVKKYPPPPPAPPPAAEPNEQKRVGVQELKLVRHGSIRYDIPKSPVTGPEASLQIFRQFFEGADREIAATLALNKQNEFIALTAVAYGTIDHVHVTPREVFKAVLAKDNAAGFIIAHNHPSGNPTPHPDDFTLLEKLRDLGAELGCYLHDFLVLGDGTDKYYSHRELHY